MMGPRVSIGLPVYNGERFLQETLRAISEQTFTDFELIISDNASTDGTQEICRAHAAQDSRLRYHRSPNNVGAALNYNKVFDLAVAPYFKWAASDDLIARDFIERCVKELDRDGSVILATSEVQLIDESGRWVDFDEKMAELFASLGERYRPIEGARNLSSFTPYKRFADIVRRKVWHHETYGLVRSDVLRKTSLHGPFPGSDKVLLAELTLLGRFYKIPEALFFSRVHTHADPRSRSAALTMDTSWSRRIYFPEAQVVKGYLRAIGRSDVDALDKICCVLIVMRKIIERDNLAKLLLPGRRNYLGIDLNRFANRQQ